MKKKFRAQGGITKNFYIKNMEKKKTEKQKDALFRFRSKGGKAAAKKYGREYYVLKAKRMNEVLAERKNKAKLGGD